MKLPFLLATSHSGNSKDRRSHTWQRAEKSFCPSLPAEWSAPFCFQSQTEAHPIRRRCLPDTGRLRRRFFLFAVSRICVSVRLCERDHLPSEVASVFSPLPCMLAPHRWRMSLQTKLPSLPTCGGIALVIHSGSPCRLPYDAPTESANGDRVCNEHAGRCFPRNCPRKSNCKPHLHPGSNPRWSPRRFHWARCYKLKPDSGLCVWQADNSPSFSSYSRFPELWYSYYAYSGEKILFFCKHSTKIVIKYWTFGIKGFSSYERKVSRRWKPKWVRLQPVP